MTRAELLARKEAELVSVRAQIDATLARGAQSYTTEVQSATGFDLDKLYRRERELENEIQRLGRSTRFGKIGFSRITS
jgi:hypothetical protein